MIFKTFNSDSDKVLSKIGILGKSFEQIGISIRQRKIEIDNLMGAMSKKDAKAEAGGFWSYIFGNESIKEKPIDLSKFIELDKIKASNLLKSLQEIEIASKTNTSVWQEYFSTLSDGQKWQIEFVKNNDLQKTSTEDLVKANQQARASALAHNEAIQAQTFSAKAGSAALKVLAMAGNMIAMWGITELVKGFYDLATATDRFADSASGIGSTLSGTTSDMSSYKEETKKLWETINDQSSSIEDTTAARQRLMEIQDELLEKYGDEKDAIKLVADAVKENTTAFDDFSFSQYQEAMNQFISDNSGFWDKLAYSAIGNDSVKESMTSTMEKYLAYDNNHLFENLRKQIGADLFDQILDANDVQQIAGAITGNIDDVTKAVYQLQDALAMNKSSMDDSSFEKLNQGLALQATQASELADKYSDLYNQYILYEKILSDSDNNGYAESLNKITEAYKKYQEVATTGDADQVHESFNEYATTLQDSLNSTLIDSENGEVVARYFRNMFPALQEEFSKWQFKIDFDIEDGGIKEEIEAYAKEFSNSNEIINFDARVSNTDEQLSAYNALINIASKYHMEIDQLVSIMEEFGLVASREKENLIATLSGDEQNLIVDDWVKSLTDEEAQLANSTAFDEALKRQIENLNGAALSAENYSAALDEVKASQDGIGDETPVSPLTISQTIDQLNTQLKPAFDSLKSAYQDIFTDDGFTLENVDTSMLSCIKSAIDELNNMEDVDINIDYSSFENLAKVLTDSSSTAEDVQNSFNNFASTILDAVNPAISQCDGESYKLLQTLLESMGIVNAEEVLMSQLGYSYEEYANAKESAANAGIDLNNSIDSVATALQNEGLMATEDAQQIMNYMLAKMSASGATIDVSSTIGQLAEEFSWLADLIDQWGLYYSVSKKGSGQGNVKGSKNLGVGNYTPTQTTKVKQKVEIEPVFDGNKANRAAKSAGSKAGKSFEDGLKEQLSDLDSVISGITGRIDDQISSINEQKSAALDSIDAQKEALEEAKDAAVEALEAERDARLEVIETQKAQLEEQIKLIDKQIKAKQDEIKAIEDAASARQRELDLQRAQFELEKMQNMRTQLVK